ncbi:MAG: hypothetical protein RID91_18330, partial [Azospirillaceae bacterium]
MTGVNATDLAALLRWYEAVGVDEAIDLAPADRTVAPAPAAAPAPTPAAPPIEARAPAPGTAQAPAAPAPRAAP